MASENNPPLWDRLGTPVHPHPECPRCGEDELGSHFDSLWCHRCGWRASVTSMHVLRNATLEEAAAAADAVRDRYDAAAEGPGVNEAQECADAIRALKHTEDDNG